MNAETRAKEQLSQKIISHLWPEVIFVEVGSPIDRSGIDGYIGKQTMQHKYDIQIPKYYRLWDEHYAKERGHPEDSWFPAQRIADIYIFTTGGNWEKQIIAGSYAIFVPRLSLDTAENGKTVHEIPKGAATSRGYFVPIRELRNCIIRRVGNIVAKPSTKIRGICDYGFPDKLPSPPWQSCRPCLLYDGENCNSETASSRRIAISAPDAQ